MSSLNYAIIVKNNLNIQDSKNENRRVNIPGNHIHDNQMHPYSSTYGNKIENNHSHAAQGDDCRRIPSILPSDSL